MFNDWFFDSTGNSYSVPVTRNMSVGTWFAWKAENGLASPYFITSCGYGYVDMGEALGQRFVDATFPPSAKDRAMDMVEEILADPEASPNDKGVALAFLLSAPAEKWQLAQAAPVPGAAPVAGRRLRSRAGWR
mgnify:CR=1 FL=1